MFDCGFTKENNWFRYRAAAIIVENDCVLLASNAKADYFYSVGGGIHMGEKAEDAVVREVFEETGAHYEVDRLAVIHENFFTDSDEFFKDLKCHEIALYFLMISHNYYMLPSHKVPFKDIIPGSIFAAIGFWVVTYAFTLYTGLTTSNDIIYGSISNIVALMFWFWLLAWVMCIGVSFNRVWWATRKNNNIPIPKEVKERRKPMNIF